MGKRVSVFLAEENNFTFSAERCDFAFLHKNNVFVLLNLAKMRFSNFLREIKILILIKIRFFCLLKI